MVLCPETFCTVLNFPFLVSENLETEKNILLLALTNVNIYEPGHEKMCFMPYVNNKGTD